MKGISEIRPSPIAGQWYPGDAKRLAAELDRYLSAARLPEIKGQVVAVMAPHAGMIYSGPVAAYAFAALRGLTPDIVVVVSPSHYPFHELLLTTAHAFYNTPLGQIPVDQEALKALEGLLQEGQDLGLARVAYDQEHSLEIELPFLQRVLGAQEKPFSLLPVMICEQTVRVAQSLGEALSHLFGAGGLLAGQAVVLVASTDLSHFYTQKRAEELDAEFLRRVEAFDPLGVLQAEEEGKGFACGRGALAAVMWAARGLGADRAQILHHATSGDVSGDYHRVVGYGAAVFTRPADAPAN